MSSGLGAAYVSLTSELFERGESFEMSRSGHTPFMRRSRGLGKCSVTPMFLAAAALFLPTAQLSAGNRIADLARKCESGKVDACRDLTKTALTDRSLSTRIAAISELHDAAVLLSIARNPTEHREARLAAVDAVSDHKMLAQVAGSKDLDDAVRREASAHLVEQIANPADAADEELIVEAARRDSWENEFLGRAVAKVTDKEVLSRIVLSVGPCRSDCYRYREDRAWLFAAIRRIQDTQILSRIVNECKDVTVQADALAQITDWTCPLK